MATIFYIRYPASGGGSSSNPSVGTNGAIAPSSSTEVGGIGLDGNLHAFTTDNSGNQNVNVVSSALPTGSATAANQALQITQETGIHSDTTAINGKLNSLGQKTMANSMPVAIASDQSSIPITAASLPLPTGAATEATLSSLNGKVTVVNTGAVTISSALPAGANAIGSVSVSNFPATQPVSGTVTANQGTSPWVENVSQFGGSAVVTGTGASGSGIPRVTVANDSNILATQSGTWNITNISGTVSLPTGASTAANQATEIASLASIDTKTLTAGQKTMANSYPVVIASNQSAVPVSASFAPNANGNSPGSGTVSTVITLTAPATTVGFVLMNLDTSTANVRYRIGATATSASGQQLQPGRDTGYIPCGANISLCAESGTQNYDVQWILQ